MITIHLHDTERYRIVVAIHVERVTFSCFAGSLFQSTQVPPALARDRFHLRRILSAVEAVADAQVATRVVDFEQLHRRIEDVCRRPASS